MTMTGPRYIAFVLALSLCPLLNRARLLRGSRNACRAIELPLQTFLGDREARQRESSCRGAAASRWKVARQWLSTAPSCWSSRARALSSPRER